MSWIIPLGLILIIGFACAFGLCEWAAKRMHKGRREPD